MRPAIVVRYRDGWVVLAGMMTVAALLWLLPEGLHPSLQPIPKLMLASLAAVLLVLRSRRVAPFDRRRTYRWALAALAVLSGVAWLNFFDFHGRRTFVQLHDVAHYYLGTKYYSELGYTGLYKAMARAELEITGGYTSGDRARDLESYREVPIGDLLDRSESVKEAFGNERWADFKDDVRTFRDSMGPSYRAILLDHGFNPTPLWAVVGGWLSNLVPAGDRSGIFLLTLIDPVLLMGLLCATGWAFGLESVLLAITAFCLLFGGDFGWVGGGFLRFDWLFCVVVATSFLRKRRPRSAGALFAAGSILRVFPLVFVVPLALRSVERLWRRGELDTADRKLWSSYLTTVLLGVGLSLGTLDQGVQHWTDFRHQMEVHVAHSSSNLIGMVEVMTYRPLLVSEEGWDSDARATRRSTVRRLQLVIVFLPVCALVGLLARWHTRVSSVVLGIPLLFFGLSLAGYYYVFVLLLALPWRHRHGLLAGLFVVEAVCWAAALATADRSTVFFLHSLLLFLLLGFGILLPAARRDPSLSRQPG